MSEEILSTELSDDELEEVTGGTKKLAFPAIFTTVAVGAISGFNTMIMGNEVDAASRAVAESGEKVEADIQGR